MRPGDVISTGTCLGVGGREGGPYLKPGDRITVTLGDLGTLQNPVQAHE